MKTRTRRMTRIFSLVGVLLLVISMLAAMAPQKPAIAAEERPENVVVKNGMVLFDVKIEKISRVSKETLLQILPEERDGINSIPVNEFSLRNGLDRVGWFLTSADQYLYVWKTTRPLIVRINGKMAHFPDQQPIIKENRTLVPIRTISEAIGAEVDWDNEARMAKIVLGEKTIEIFINGKMFVDGVELEIDVPAQIINNRTMLPLRAVGESLGFTVAWVEQYDQNVVILRS